MKKAINFKRTKLACYLAYFTMSSVFCVPAILFVTFKNLYNISYTLLGTLVLINFFTQLCIDLIFTFFSKHFNTKIVVKILPLITSLGLILYGLLPMVFPNSAYIGLLIGTVVFSVSAGFSEVLLSPTIASIPSDNPQKDMSLLHSLYAFGVFTMVLISTLFINFIGEKYWHYLIFFLALLPIIASVLFMFSPIPEMNDKEDNCNTKTNKNRIIGLVLCCLCIFFGASAENAMGNWMSSYLENALSVNKTLGDIIGVAGFAILLGLGRILYAKFGKSIVSILLISMIGSLACYVTAGLTSNVIISIIACVLTGVFTSMLWPGTLILMEEKIPSPGVGGYALMAAFGDLGASTAPQLMGVIIDKVSTSNFALELETTLNMTAEQIALKVGMISMSIFPLIGIAVIIIIISYFKKHDKKQNLTNNLGEE